MNKNEKVESIAEAKELIENATAVYLTDYSRINVEDISGIRNQFRKDGVTYRVFKNTLFKRALVESGKFEKLADHLEGMTGFAFASTNPVAPAKIIKKYNDTSQKLPLKACYIETQYFDGSKLAELAELPTKDELIAGILGSLNSPASGIVGSIAAVIRNLVSVIDEVSKKKAA
jgi:large subunit ribosomal protein L10